MSHGTKLRSAVAACAVVALAAGAVAVTSSVEPTRSAVATEPTTVPTTNAQLSCPEAGRGKGVVNDLLAVTPVEVDGAAGSGELAVHALSTGSATDDHEIARTEQPGEPVIRRLGRASSSAVTVDASGQLAPAASAAQRTVFTGGQDSGLAVAACAPTADTWWFTGLDTSVGSTSRLVLSNPTPALAVVDLTLFDAKGSVSAPGRSGIPIAPRSQQSIDLARFAPGRPAVTLHVRATRGRVAAAVDIARIDGATAAGHEWLAPSQPPAAEVLVNAGDPGNGDQRLVLTNVSGREALVSVRVLEKAGPFTPRALSELRLRPGRTVVENVSELTDEAAAFAVTTDQPQAGLVATVVSESARAPVDFSTASSSPALDGPAVVPVFSGARAVVVFATTAPGGGVVRLQGYDDTGEPVRAELRLPVKAGTTVSWSPPTDADIAYVVATTSEGEVHGSVRYEGREGRASAPLMSGATTVTRPVVRPGR